MVRLVNKVQRTITGVTYPKGLYSRILTLEVETAAGAGNESWQFTERVADRCWVVGLDMYLENLAFDTVRSTFFQISAGREIPAAAGEIVTRWDSFFQHRGLKNYPRVTYWYSCHFYWPVHKLFTGGRWRFGFWVQNIDAGGGAFGLCSIMISEG